MSNFPDLVINLEALSNEIADGSGMLVPFTVISTTVEIIITGISKFNASKGKTRSRPGGKRRVHWQVYNDKIKTRSWHGGKNGRGKMFTGNAEGKKGGWSTNICNNVEATQ